MRIGFIGLGVMGAPMARNLLEAGHDLHVHRVKERSQSLVDAGATASPSPAAAATDAEIVILILPNTPDVEAVLLGAGGVLGGMGDGALVIVMRSIFPVQTEQFAVADIGAGGQYVDAPVSGGEVGARDGALTVLIGDVSQS